MLDRLLDLYRAHVRPRASSSSIPSFADQMAEAVRAMSSRRSSCVEQPTPTGMLDAILLARARSRASAAEHVWITWCDQVAVHPETVQPARRDRSGEPAARRWSCRRCGGAHPYIHLERDAAGRIVRVLHRREGDAMPEVGESDMGLFSLLARGLSRAAPGEFAEAPEVGAATGERNFLPFIPWIAARGDGADLPVRRRDGSRSASTRPRSCAWSKRTSPRARREAAADERSERRASCRS